MLLRKRRRTARGAAAFIAQIWRRDSPLVQALADFGGNIGRKIRSAFQACAEREEERDGANSCS
jgi:hypothetical protein